MYALESQHTPCDLLILSNILQKVSYLGHAMVPAGTWAMVTAANSAT